MVHRSIRLDIRIATHNITFIRLRCSIAVCKVETGAVPQQARGGRKAVGIVMMQQFETIQKVGKENVDAALKSFGAASKGLQTIAVESSDYTKKTFEQGTALLEKLVAVKTIDKAFEIQADYAKSAYEAAIAQATKIGELYTSMAKDAYKPFEAAMAKVAPAAK
jgi:hypothetical protein